MMKNFLIPVIILFSHHFYAQQYDIWSGDYAVKSADLTPVDTFRISKIADVAPENVASRLGTAVNRWNIMSKSDGYKETIEARNFVYIAEEKEDEYQQFGWTKLYLQGKIKCIDAGHLFLCQTNPNTKINVKKEKPFFTESGIFGVRLNYGLIKLEKLTK